MNVLRESMINDVATWQRNPLELKERDHIELMGNLISDLMNYLTDDQLLDVLRAHQIVKSVIDSD